MDTLDHANQMWSPVYAVRCSRLLVHLRSSVEEIFEHKYVTQGSVLATHSMCR